MIAYSDLLEIPFVDGGRGPHGYDCYGLVRELYRRCEVYLPDENISVYACRSVQDAVEDRKKQWIKLDRPEPNCTIVVKPTVAGLSYHMGFYLGENKFIHVGLNFPVRVERLHEIQHKVEGYYQHVDYVRHNT